MLVSVRHRWARNVTSRLRAQFRRITTDARTNEKSYARPATVIDSSTAASPHQAHPAPPRLVPASAGNDPNPDLKLGYVDVIVVSMKARGLLCHVLTVSYTKRTVQWSLGHL